MTVIVGVVLHVLGGGAAASFYLPFKKVRNWAWESYWLISGIAAWIVMPLIIGWFTINDLALVITNAPAESLFWTFIFGLVWGIGGLTFGLSMRYLGLSLGYAVALGFSAAFGTLMPPVYDGQIHRLLSSLEGLIVLTGVVLCLAGIGVCGWAGKNKERELLSEERNKVIDEFNFSKGILVAFVSGLLSACMAFGLAAGKPIAKLAVDFGTDPIWQNNAVLVVVLWGGFTTNFLWCIALNIKNKTTKDYKKGNVGLLAHNYIYSSLAGAIWFMQFFFYGMGSTKMGKFEFVSWILHMSFIIVLSNIWGLYLKEWEGCSSSTKKMIQFGLGIIVLSIFVIGYGTQLEH